MSEIISAKIESLEAPLATKVKEIIEGRWGKRLADVKDLSLERLYKRLARDNRVYYQQTNRYILDVQFRTSREPRRETFTQTA